MSTVAKCSVKNNSEVCWAGFWDMCKLFAASHDVLLSVSFAVSDMEYACLCLSGLAHRWFPVSIR